MDKQEIYAILNKAYFAEDCHERQLLDNLRRLIAGATYFVDVGASLGQYTRAVSAVLRGGQILAIEADPVRHEELARNARRWADESGCHIDTLFAAISDSAGETSFFTTRSNVSGGLFPHPASDSVDWHEIQVPAVTLDDVCGAHIPDFVKADIEGAELRMLKGASRILAARRTAFLLELHPWDDPGVSDNETVLTYMRRNGYYPIDYYQHTLFLPFGTRYVREKAAASWRILRRRWLAATSA